MSQNGPRERGYAPDKLSWMDRGMNRWTETNGQTDHYEAPGEWGPKNWEGGGG